MRNEPFQWNEKYGVDDGVIDAEHRRLFELANAVFEFEEPDTQDKEFKKTVMALFDYMRSHFRNEQALMEEIVHPRLQQQIEAHAAIIAEMTTLIKQCYSFDKLAFHLRSIMVGWVLNHIIEEDGLIGATLRERSAAERPPVEATAG